MQRTASRSIILTKKNKKRVKCGKKYDQFEQGGIQIFFLNIKFSRK
jgi:hypothetical protein